MIEYLDKRLPRSDTKWPDLMPGDALDAASGEVVYRAKERLNGDWEGYIRVTRPRSSRSSRRAPTNTARATTASGCSRASGRCSRGSSRA